MLVLICIERILCIFIFLLITNGLCGSNKYVLRVKSTWPLHFAFRVEMYLISKYAASLYIN